MSEQELADLEALHRECVGLNGDIVCGYAHEIAAKTMALVAEVRALRGEISHLEDCNRKLLQDLTAARNVLLREGMERDNARTQLDDVYAQRNALACLLAAVVNNDGWGDLYGAGLAQDTTQAPEWQTTILIDTPCGQISFHVHERERETFGRLPPYRGRFGPGWDGHTDAEKWDRVRRSIAPSCQEDPT